MLGYGFQIKKRLQHQISHTINLNPEAACEAMRGK